MEDFFMDEFYDYLAEQVDRCKKEIRYWDMKMQRALKEVRLAWEYDQDERQRAASQEANDCEERMRNAEWFLETLTNVETYLDNCERKWQEQAAEAEEAE